MCVGIPYLPLGGLLACQVAFLGDAVADDAREVGCRHVGRVLVAEVVVDADLGLYRMGHLFLKGRVEVVKRLELR